MMSGLNSPMATVIVKNNIPVSPLAYSPQGGSISTETIIDCHGGEMVWVKVVIANPTALIPCVYQYGDDIISLAGFTGQLLFK